MRGWDAQDGFTLVELMVVVLIIGILVTVAIPAFNAASDNAKRRTCMANQRLIEGGVEHFRAGGGVMWTTAGRLNGNGTAGTADKLVPSYITGAPKCPKSGQFYWVTAQGIVEGDMNAAWFTAGHSHY